MSRELEPQHDNAIAADMAEYVRKVSPELDACFKAPFPMGRLAIPTILNERGGLQLVRHLEKHGFRIVPDASIETDTESMPW